MGNFLERRLSRMAQRPTMVADATEIKNVSTG